MKSRRLFLLLSSLVCSSALANELLVDRRSLQLNDLLTITISLEGSYASADSVDIPLENLVLSGEPWVSSEFAWINGNVVRRKVFRYRARPLASGAARVGPIVLDAPDGQRETLNAIAIQVLPDRASGSNDAEAVLRELIAGGRDPLFVIAESSKAGAYVGEPIEVTWWLYNATSVQQWQIVSIPKLTDFWTEERPRNERPERVRVGDVTMQRLPIRRVTLFPLHSGELGIGGVAIEAAVMRRLRGGPFSMFEGDLIQTTFTSAPVEITVRPIPPGPAVDAVGALELTCQAPVQRNGGPVVVGVSVRGAGNLRSARAPHFESAVSGSMQIEGGEVAVSHEEGSLVMKRDWRYLIFPSQAELLQVPALAMTVFDPSSGQRRELRCAAAFIDATSAGLPDRAGGAAAPAAPQRPLRWPWIATALLLAVAVLGAVPRIRAELAVRREARDILRDASPAEVRTRLEQRVQIDLRDPSDRGDAWRALRSLLDAMDRDRDIGVGAEKELERRVREVLRLKRTH